MSVRRGGVRHGGASVRHGILTGKRSALVDIGQFVVLTGGVVWLILRGAESLGYNWQWYRVPRYFFEDIDGELIWGPLVRGFLVTIEITALSLLLTIVVGLVTALLRFSDSLVGRGLARCYLEVIRNTPLLVQLYLFYFCVAPILGIDRYWTAVLTLAIFEGAYASEIFRAGIVSVEKGQWEAAFGLGLSQYDTYRYIVLPQAFRLILPPMTGQAVSLIKHSAIISVIAVEELATEGRNIIADTFMSFEIWFTVAAMYLVLTISLSVFVSYLEYRVRAR